MYKSSDSSTSGGILNVSVRSDSLISWFSLHKTQAFFLKVNKAKTSKLISILMYKSTVGRVNSSDHLLLTCQSSTSLSVRPSVPPPDTTRSSERFHFMLK